MARRSGRGRLGPLARTGAGLADRVDRAVWRRVRARLAARSRRAAADPMDLAYTVPSEGAGARALGAVLPGAGRADALSGAALGGRGRGPGPDRGADRAGLRGPRSR